MAGGWNWTLYEATTCAEALACLRLVHAPVVICRQELPDGDWRSLLRELGRLERPPQLIVCAPFADARLWAEILSAGAYDVLMTPFLTDEVHHVVSLAADSAQRLWRVNRRVLEA